MGPTCDICGEPLDEKKPYQVSLTGDGVHVACLARELDEGEGDDEA
jgi:hypothetical protein